MAYEENQQTITLPAAAALTQYSFVRVDSSGNAAYASADTDPTVIGVVQNAPAGAGEAATVAFAGVTKVMATTGGITAGSRVMLVGTAGLAAVYSGTTAQSLGIAIQGAASGKLGTVLLRTAAIS